MFNLKKSMLLLLVIFTISACEDSSTANTNKDCNNQCAELNVNSCNDSKLMTCKKDNDGCFILTEVKICKDGCDENKCINSNNRSKKTKITIGTAKKIDSANFKLKLNLGKVTSTKDLKSSNYKVKVGTSTIEQK